MRQEKPYNTALGFLRRSLTLALVVVLLALSKPTLASLIIGVILVTLGETVRFWAAGYLLKTKELVTGGPYRYTRNPLYLGRLLIFTGLCSMVHLPYYGSWIALGLGCGLFFGYYLPRKERVEPARLRQTHGEAFERYFQAVPALFPRLRPYADAGAQHWSVQRMARNREHWMVVGLTLATLFLVWRVVV